MKFSAEEILKMCEDAPVVLPQFEEYAMARINPGEKAHIVFSDRDIFVIAASNTKKLVGNKTYGGYLMVVQNFNPTRDYFHLELYGFYTDCVDLLFSNYNSDATVRPLASNGANILRFEENDYTNVQSNLLASNPGVYISHPYQLETDMKQLRGKKPNFALRDGELVF